MTKVCRSNIYWTLLKLHIEWILSNSKEKYTFNLIFASWKSTRTKCVVFASIVTHLYAYKTILTNKQKHFSWNLVEMDFNRMANHTIHHSHTITPFSICNKKATTAAIQPTDASFFCRLRMLIRHHSNTLEM